jgi:hypothetical protein
MAKAPSVGIWAATRMEGRRQRPELRGKMIMTPRVRQKVDEKAFWEQTVLPQKAGKERQK